MSLNIVMVAPFAYSNKGTVRARMEPVAEQLVKRGHSVHIIIPPWDKPTEGGQVYEKNGISITHLKSRGDSLLGHLFLTLRTIDKVNSLSPDIVHAFKPIGEAGMTALFYALFTDIPVVLDSDDWEGNGGQRERSDKSHIISSILNIQEEYIPRAVDAVTVASRTLETQMWGNSVPPERTFYAPNGQTEDRIEIEGANENTVRDDLGIGDSPVVFLYTRFFEYDLRRAARIFEGIEKQNPETEFVVVGQGRYDEHDEFAAEIQSLGLSDSVHMVGWVEFDELPDYFAAADVAVYPFADTLVNRSKCPAKLTELLVTGIPVVADDVGQISEYMRHDETGFLVEPGDEDEFVKRVLELLESETKRNEMGIAAKERILTAFSWASITDEVEQSYELVLD